MNISNLSQLSPSQIDIYKDNKRNKTASFSMKPTLQADEFFSSSKKTSQPSFSGKLKDSIASLFRYKRQEEVHELQAQTQEIEFTPEYSATEQEYNDYIDRKLENPTLPYKYNDVPQTQGVQKDIWGNTKVLKGQYRCDELEKKKVYTGRYTPTSKVADSDTIDTQVLKEKFNQDKSLDYSVPISKNGHYSPNHIKHSNIGEAQEPYLGKPVNTDLTIRYGEAINWKNSKIARDILQNFYDGHNKTLEGTHLNIKYNDSTKKYTITVSGQSIYPHDFIQYIGKGTKFDDKKSAGGFGEGSKILACNLLAKKNEKGKYRTENVKFSSANWQMTLSRSSDDISSSIMQRTLEKVPHQNGNTLEFDTDDKELVDNIIEALNWFESPYNIDFQNLDFENEHFAMKILPERERGNLYLIQRFEYNQDGQWDNTIEEADLIFKEKPSDKIFSVSRDRTYLNRYNIGTIFENIVSDFSDEEILDLIVKTDSVWKEVKKDNAVTEIVSKLADEAYHRNIGIDFKDYKFVAVPQYASKHDLEHLKLLGYIPVNNSMRKLVPTVEEIYQSNNSHIPQKPTEDEMKRMILLKEAVSLVQKATSRQIEDDIYRCFEKTILPYSQEELPEDPFEDKQFLKQLMKKQRDYSFTELFSEEDCQRPVILFDSNKESDKNNSVAKAILGYDKELKTTQYRGHWIDRDYLNTGNFYKLLATYLHEINHQHGEDGSSEFTYVLTDELGIILSILSSQPETAAKLNILAQKFEQINS